MGEVHGHADVEIAFIRLSFFEPIIIGSTFK